tara:strand:+ start:1161 stop:1388 length:228 start_codon:yes stop_codon:yes gene_type:complete
METKTIIKYVGYLIMGIGFLDLALFYTTDNYFIPMLIVIGDMDLTVWAVIALGGIISSLGSGKSLKDAAEDLLDE